MKIVTVRPPWSDLLAMRIKKAEFRSWKTKYRGRLAIHAGMNVDVAAREHFWRVVNDPMLLAREFPRIVLGEDLERLKGYLAHPRKGIVVAVGRLAACEKSEYWYEELGFSSESWAWIFEDMMELKREVRMSGRQGLFTASPQDAERIRAGLHGPSEMKVKLEHTTLQLTRTKKKAKPKGPRTYEHVGTFKVPVED